ncbi:hypothetical protein E4T44_10295 [Aureobasidium sp. EXF-8845]|nr:hypothetical protein E4T44_10295 [Aureobasidium sp. EXF-8845]KAI4834069.1 hypothetical protein E4T45_10137 [Aureobasidium sp. EXF-8846]
MSGCANAGQALSRGLKLYTSRSSHVLPFLYQTPTLCRYYSALQDLAKENAPKTEPNLRLRKPAREPTYTPPEVEKKPEYEDYVPFETPGAAESAVIQNTIQGESLTGTERNAFAQLEALTNAPKRPATRKTRKTTQESKPISLDDVLNEAITVIEASGAKDKKQFYTSTKPKRSEYDTLNLAPALETNSSIAAAEQGMTEFKRLGQEDRRTLAALQNAKTDTMLWSILESRLFSPFALLHLDSPAPASATIPPTHRQFILQVFPLRLVSAASILRNHFPTSNLILAILPRVKQLGPSAYALATTADLYNQLLAFQFRKFADVDACNDLLQEMDDNVVEPSPSTLKVLDYILNFRHDCIENNKLGTNVKSLFTTEKYRREFAVLEKWRGRVEQSLAEQQSRLQRKADNEEMRLREEKEEQGPVRYITSLPDAEEMVKRLQIKDRRGPEEGMLSIE